MASQESSSRRSVSSDKRGKRMLVEVPPPPPPCPNDDLFAAHFEKVLDPVVGDLKVICSYCARLFRFSADEKEFGTLRDHLNKKHRSKIGNESETESEQSSEGSTGTDADVFAYTYKRARNMIAKLVCEGSLPFKFAESDSFENLMKCCNPLAKKVPQAELIHEIITIVRESLLVLIKDFVKMSNRVSICSDVWTNDCTWQFVRISCHWVDESWTIQKRLIAFKSLSEEYHSAAEISHEMHKSLQIYGLGPKVFSISFDNNTASTYSLEALSNACQPSISAKFFHDRCVSYILTMCAQDALNVLEEETAPIRELAMHIFSADTSLLKKWSRFCKKRGLIPRRFILGYSARWDITYRMLNGCCQYRDALCSFFSEQQFDDVQVSSSQWEACSTLCQILGVFYHVIQELSHVYSPTSVLVLDNCAKVAVLFNSLMGRDGLAECVAKMMAKWLKYFGEIPTVFLLAKVFDPRIRLHGLEKMLGIYYDALFPIKDEKTPIPSVVVANVKKCLYDIFQEYSVKHGASLGMSVSSSSDGNDIPLSIRLQNLYNEVSEKRPRSYGSNPFGELETYLTANFEYIVESEFDILKWWSRMTMQFPILSSIAKDVLAVPASTVSVEQAFGTEGYTLNARQSHLSMQDQVGLQVLEKQLLLGDWTKAERRDQENDYDDFDESEVISDSEFD
ncbi:zinc finger BED domain-containing protein RICESLEEPER 2-like [Salvia miltiorrhiza]|uniref:zinc finger BED domain-containing protein RICESLEEPER 2-like n=1 Tax=Salvia miltiorrhiza TaxID=226208 RepID=UPI0025ACA474|nr:zinc finger BED domain-containing protein RICESLEEPER 2-like [Salvia miltiorrhiza]